MPNYYTLEYDTVDDFTIKRAPYRTEHLQLVRDAHGRGDVALAGAVGDPPDGALLIFKAASPSVAEDFAKRDPYVLNRLVTRWRVRPWHVVVGAED
jgi:uncharacterized protein